MDYKIAKLTEEKEQELKKLEEELGVILIAYENEAAQTDIQNYNQSQE